MYGPGGGTEIYGRPPGTANAPAEPPWDEAGPPPEAPRPSWDQAGSPWEPPRPSWDTPGPPREMAQQPWDGAGPAWEMAGPARTQAPATGPVPGFGPDPAARAGAPEHHGMPGSFGGPGGPATPGGYTGPNAPVGEDWGQPAAGRSDSFGPDGQPGVPDQREPEPAPQVRNGRVLVAVLAAAVLLLVVPFAIVWLATRSESPRFDVNACVKQAGTTAVQADCAESGAFRVVSKVDDEAKCPVKGQPTVVQTAPEGKKEVLCLKPAAEG